MLGGWGQHKTTDWSGRFKGYHELVVRENGEDEKNLDNKAKSSIETTRPSLRMRQQGQRKTSCTRNLEDREASKLLKKVDLGFNNPFSGCTATGNTRAIVLRKAWTS